MVLAHTKWQQVYCTLWLAILPFAPAWGTALTPTEQWWLAEEEVHRWQEAQQIEAWEAAQEAKERTWEHKRDRHRLRHFESIVAQDQQKLVEDMKTIEKTGNADWAVNELHWDTHELREDTAYLNQLRAQYEPFSAPISE